MPGPLPDDPSATPRGRTLLFSTLYDELHRIARREVQRGSGLTLGATTLLHETYLRMRNIDGVSFDDEGSFFAYASRAMRNLVIDFARRRQTQKRGGAFEITRLPTEVPDATVDSEALEQLGAAIDALADMDASLAQLVDLKFFCGLTFIEIASMRGVSERTAQRDWMKARTLLKRILDGSELLP